MQKKSEEEHARATEEKKQAFQEFQAKLSDVKGKEVKELDPEVEKRYYFHSLSSLFPPLPPLIHLSLIIFKILIRLRRRQELKEKSEEEKKAVTEEKKKQFQKLQKTLSSVKGKGIIRIEVDEEREREREREEGDGEYNKKHIVNHTSDSKALDPEVEKRRMELQQKRVEDKKQKDEAVKQLAKDNMERIKVNSPCLYLSSPPLLHAIHLSRLYSYPCLVNEGTRCEGFGPRCGGAQERAAAAKRDEEETRRGSTKEERERSATPRELRYS